MFFYFKNTFTRLWIKYLLKCIALFLICFQPGLSIGKDKNFFDIYRTDQISAEAIEKKFRKKIEKMRTLIGLAVLGKPDSAEGGEIDQIINEITTAIHSMGEFEYVKLRPSAYPNGGVYVTVDIVDKKDKQRMPSFAKINRDKSFSDPDHLFQKWKDYLNTGFSINFAEKRKLKPEICPVHHCIHGFGARELKPYKKVFDTLVIKNKLQLIEILRKDKDEEKRASAAFLLAHLPDGKEVISILSPSLNDEDLLVRGAVMRVFGSILEKGEVKVRVPVKKMFALMDSPFMEERNKAMYVISGLIKEPLYAEEVKKRYSQNLVALLKLHQPDQHIPAYGILKQISGKSFNEHDYKAWEEWAATQQ